MKPFLKWAGNKYRIIEKLQSIFPEANRLIEPFVGSAAVFLNTNYSEYLLSDNNHDLINLYHYLQREGGTFIDYCEHFFISENNARDKFDYFRREFNSSTDTRFKSALFLYLNKHGFNGLCRYNSKGIFNVPFGTREKAYFPRKELINFHEKSQRAVFQQADFISTLKKAKAGDLVYCDPPYVSLSLTANFTRYSQKDFNEMQQLKLAKLAQKLSEKGITTIISNHHTDFTQDAYAKARILTFDVSRTISCNGNKREKVKELLAIFEAKYPATSSSF